MREMMPYIWIGIIVFSVIAGINMYSRVLLWLIPAGLAAFILSLTGAEVWQQAVIFFILVPVLLILSRTFFKKIIKPRRQILAVGATAIVTEEINNYKDTGEIIINGLVHDARADEDDIIYEAGLVVTVIELDGARAVCSR